TDNYFHTGDIGEFDSDGFLKITDRKKEMFKTSGGKYIAPTLIENQLKQSRFIDQVMVIGEGEKMPAALVQINFEFVEEWCKIHGISVTSKEDLISNQKVIDRIQKEIDEAKNKFGRWELIRKFEFTPDVWSIDGGHLTRTMQMKRNVIKEKYICLYHTVYHLSI